MKKLLATLLVFFAASAAFAGETIKLNLSQQAELLSGLSSLDGSLKLDRDNARVAIAYDFSGATRIAIAHDITALKGSIQNVQDAWKAYLKGAGISDETKETPEQHAEVAKIQNAPAEVSIIKISVDDLKLDANAIPPTAISALKPVIK
jgi:hypothetical protein